MKKIVAIGIIIGTLGAVSFFAYSVISKRYFTRTETVEQKNAPIQFFDSSKPLDPSVQTSTPESENPTAPGDENSAPPITDQNGNTAKNIKASITTQHCNDDCKAFANDLTLLAYCQEVCGITPAKNVSDCSSKTGLEKDYCQKDLAIAKTDSALCESVADDNLRKTCKNRVAQDLMEKAQSGNNSGL